MAKLPVYHTSEMCQAQSKPVTPDFIIDETMNLEAIREIMLQTTNAHVNMVHSFASFLRLEDRNWKDGRKSETKDRYYGKFFASHPEIGMLYIIHEVKNLTKGETEVRNAAYWFKELFGELSSTVKDAVKKAFSTAFEEYRSDMQTKARAGLTKDEKTELNKAIKALRVAKESAKVAEETAFNAGVRKAYLEKLNKETMGQALEAIILDAYEAGCIPDLIKALQGAQSAAKKLTAPMVEPVKV